MAEIFTADIVSLQMPAVSGYSHPTGIALAPEKGNPTILVSPAGRHAPLYQEFLHHFPDFRPEGGELLTDPSLVALGWQRKTDHTPVIISNIDHLGSKERTTAELAARALSLVIASIETSGCLNRTLTTTHLRIQELEAVAIGRRHK